MRRKAYCDHILDWKTFAELIERIKFIVLLQNVQEQKSLFAHVQNSFGSERKPLHRLLFPYWYSVLSIFPVDKKISRTTCRKLSPLQNATMLESISTDVRHKMWNAIVMKGPRTELLSL